MSGETDSELSVKERLDKLDKILEEYMVNKGLPVSEAKTREDARGFMDMSRDELARLTNEQRYEIAYILGRMCFDVRRDFNKETARVGWADSKINQIIALKTPNYKGYSYEERKHQAIADNEVAKKLNEIKIYAKTRADYLNQLDSHIQFMAKTISGMLYVREKNNG